MSQPALLPRQVYDEWTSPSEQARDSNFLADIWRSLMAGESRVESHFTKAGELGLSLLQSTELRPLIARERRTLQKFLMARAQKMVSVDERVAASTLVRVLEQALRKIGLSCVPSRVPFLVAAACAAQAGSSIPGVRCSEQRLDGQLLTLVTLHDPRAWLSLRLTPSQTQVILLRLEGLTHSDIAARRSTALTTVANLLSAAYRRLGISGRLELMARLASEYQLGNVPVPTLEDDAGPPFTG